jgi:hypothetical protein
MNANQVKQLLASGDTSIFRAAVRRALRSTLDRAIRAGFSADCDPSVLESLTFSDSAVLATSRGTLRCSDHVFSVAVPFSDL